jgi:protein-L-isoaspartate(D-aspartate) O-methyltransferase
MRDSESAQKPAAGEVRNARDCCAAGKRGNTALPESGGRVTRCPVITAGSCAGSTPDDRLSRARERMVDEQIASRGVCDARVLAAMRSVPRHRFVPERMIDEAYADYPLPIGQGQTISQPYIVAFMTEALELTPGARVLEVGTGCGYQAAVLAAAGFRVFTTEIRPVLAEGATSLLRELGHLDIAVRCSDGTLGWPEEAPFEGIVVSAAAADCVPPALFEQLSPAGTLVIPVGREMQILWRYRRTASGWRGEQLLDVRFVPLIVSSGRA